MTSKSIVITDGWHPTVNPSSRMPIHHHRYVELLGNTEGILNELPRPYGGSTLRSMKIDENGFLIVKDLNKPIHYVPWWIQSTSTQAQQIISNIFNMAMINTHCAEIDTYQYVFERFLYYSSLNPQLTLGETIDLLNADLYSVIYPALPKLQLVNIAKSSILPILVYGFEEISRNIFTILDNISVAMKKREFGELSFLKDDKGINWRVTYRPSSTSFRLLSNDKPHQENDASVDTLVTAFRAGKLIPGSMLLSIIELYISNNGFDIIHYGNTYNRHAIISAACGLENRVHTWEDNIDSWNFAFLEDPRGNRYPIHLLELIKYGKQLKPIITSLIEESLQAGKPIIVYTKGRGDLLDALLNRRP